MFRRRYEVLRYILPHVRTSYDARTDNASPMDRYSRIAQNKPILSGDRQRKLKMGEYVGRRVCLLRDLRTNGGTEFRCGEVLVVYGHWRGMLHLESPDDPRRGIRKVDRRSVEVLDVEGLGQGRRATESAEGGGA